MADNGYDGPRNTKSYLTYSDDDGESWAEPRDITKLIRPGDRIVATSPGTGIQLKRGDFKGRVVMPFNLHRKLSENDHDCTNAVAWSDDQGETWSICNDIPHVGHTGYGNEAQLVERTDGSLLYIARNAGGFHRKVSISEDGGRTWTNMRLDFGLTGTPCQGSVLRYSFPEEGESIIIQSGPANKYARNQGTVKISTDEGQKWEYSKEITPDFFAYSCLTKLQDERIGLLYESKNYREISFVTFSVDWIKEMDSEKQPGPYLSIPVVDLNDKTGMQVVADKEEGQYLGHPTTVLLEDNKTILTVYPKGHGRGAIVYKRSTDGGLTWSDRLPTPDSWSTSLEVPTIFPVIDKYGKKRLIMFSGLYPVRMAVSENEGETWSELEQIGDWGGVVVMGCMISLKTGKGHYMSFFHDDGRFFTKDGAEKSIKERENYNSKMVTLYKSVTKDGGLTWSYPEEIYKSREIHVCEPGVIRSPDGDQIAILLRENSRRDNSQIIFSNDEGRTWTRPRPLPNELTGDRHVLKYSHDGRIFISFRDRSPFKYHEKLIEIAKQKNETNYSLIAEETGLGSPSEGDWVGWVGTWDDLINGGKGQYRIRFKDNTKGWDTTYPGVELLPDGTFVVTTYGHWNKGEEPYILCMRFKLEDLDKMVK
jgi:Neuraminidase (sialidase)